MLSCVQGEKCPRCESLSSSQHVLDQLQAALDLVNSISHTDDTLKRSSPLGMPLSEACGVTDVSSTCPTQQHVKGINYASRCRPCVIGTRCC